MKKTLLTLVCGLFAFSQLIFSQTPVPIEVDDDDVVKISTNLIQVDVTVTDDKGRPIKGLTADDFEIYENGKKQIITGISFISSQTETGINTTQLTETLNIDATLPVKQLKPSDVRRTMAIVIDDLSLSFESVHHTKRALRDFINNQMQEGDLIAIVRTGGSVGALQQFTNDKRLLNAAIDKLKWNLRNGSKMTAYNSHGAFNNADVGDTSHSSSFAVGSLKTMENIVLGLKTLPGRKSILLFSDGFTITANATNTRGNTDSNSADFTRVLSGTNKLIEAATRSSVVIYSMDARGLATVNFTAADDFGSKPMGGISVVQKLSESFLRGRRDSFSASLSGLNYLTKRTGGFSIYNTNDLKGGMRKVLNDQSYYLVAYEPDSDTFDPKQQKFNKLDVKVLKDDVEVRYRSGFFGVSDNIVYEPLEILTNNDKITNAITSPFAASDINVSLSTNFKGDEKDNLFVDSYLHIKASDLKFTETENGNKQAVFDIFVANFGNNGVPTDQISKTFTINAKGKTFENVMRDGFVYYFTMPIKKAGAYQMRAAILDQATNKIGSASEFIEIPKLEKNQLMLSGILLDNISYKDWNTDKDSKQVKISANENDVENTSTAMMDTALRRFKRGTVLRYGLEVYNSKMNSKNSSDLKMRTRLFRDNKLIHEGKDTPINTELQKQLLVKGITGAINLGTEMVFGDYTLQLIVTDELAKKKRQIATQFVQFEIVE